MASKWRKVKIALGLYVPDSDQEQGSDDISQRFFDAVSTSTVDTQRSVTPTPSSSGLPVSASRRRSSPEKTCAICLDSIKTGHGHAIFTAECSHSFHFHCIASNVKHGNKECPICRANWKEVPFDIPTPVSAPHQLSRANPMIGRSHEDVFILPQTSLNHTEPSYFDFDDDEELDGDSGLPNSSCLTSLEVKTYPEVPAVPTFESNDDFTILIRLKAPPTQQSRAPVDLITVLDVSGSMAGVKLALLKRAMGFVVQNLSPSDRLSVVAFSSTARRLFPLRRMTDSGKARALLLVNALTANGGTNIAEGLKKSARIMTERKCKNAVSSIMLLSDGQDTYNARGSGPAARRGDPRALLPSDLQNPVHTFGFGADHDASAMHTIAELSGGTFSFVEAENVIQDAFAQCIGGILSVVVQELEVELHCCGQTPNLQISSIKAGSYLTNIASDGRTGSIKVGDLYAEEERNFLVTMKIPVASNDSEMRLLTVNYVFKDPITRELVSVEAASEVTIQRLESVGEVEACVDVVSQRNRLYAAEAMAEAKSAAEQGNMAAAVSILGTCMRGLSRVGDPLCVSLCAELKEMQDRMVTRPVYLSSGRAYVLSGLSSHSRQRATTRGHSTDSDSLVQAYQTPTMRDMVNLSQSTINGQTPSRMQPH